MSTAHHTLQLPLLIVLLAHGLHVLWVDNLVLMSSCCGTDNQQYSGLAMFCWCCIHHDTISLKVAIPCCNYAIRNQQQQPAAAGCLAERLAFCLSGCLAASLLLAAEDLQAICIALKQCVNCLTTVCMMLLTACLALQDALSPQEAGCRVPGQCFPHGVLCRSVAGAARGQASRAGEQLRGLNWLTPAYADASVLQTKLLLEAKPAMLVSNEGFG